MIVLLLLGWYSVLGSLTGKSSEYEALIARAEEYESNEIYIRAVDCYQQAQEYDPDSLELDLRIARDYRRMGDGLSFVRQCESINKKYDYPEEAVILLSDYYLERKQEKKALTLLQTALKKHKGNEEMQNRYDMYRYSYTKKYLMFDSIGKYRQGTAVFWRDNSCGLLNLKGSMMINSEYEWIAPQSEADEGGTVFIPVKKGGEFYIVNGSGYRIEVPQSGQNVEEMFAFSGGIAPAKINGGYGYIDTHFTPLTAFEWENATGISDGAGAVQKNGKWALINGKLELITDYIYDDIRVDEHHYCTFGERLFAKTGSEWIMLDSKGQRIGSESFEDAKVFVSDQPAAVKKDGKWGFVNKDGAITIAPSFEEAESFEAGLAPVMIGGLWGYTRQDAVQVIPAQFAGVTTFYGTTAAICESGNYWTLISLNVNESGKVVEDSIGF